MKKTIQLYSWSSPKGGIRLELIDSSNNTIAILDTQDFKRMSEAGQSCESNLDIIVYCNEYKGTNLTTDSEFKRISE